MRTLDGTQVGVEELCTTMTQAFRKAATATLPETEMKAHRPWISDRSLDLLHQMATARQEGEYHPEKLLHHRIKASVREDRAQWLEELLKTGDWQQVMKLRKGFAPKQGRLRNLQG